MSKIGISCWIFIDLILPTSKFLIKFYILYCLVVVLGRFIFHILFKDLHSLGAIQLIRGTVWHFSIFDVWFLGWNCFEILNELWIRKKVSFEVLFCFVTQSFSSKSIKKQCLIKQKKYVWHFVDPLQMSRIIWITP